MIDYIEEFIGHQLHSVSFSGPILFIKKRSGKKPKSWWPYQHHKPSKSFRTDSHEDRLIGAIDKTRKYPRRSRQEEVTDLLERGYRQGEIAEMLDVSDRTIRRDVRAIRGRLRLCMDNKKRKKDHIGG